MTEARWLACADPRPMLDHIQPRTTERKLRLFLAACARLVWDSMPVPEAREAVEVAERWADGLAADAERQRVSERLYAIPGEHRRATGGNWATALRPEEVSAYFCALVSVHRPSNSRLTSRPSWQRGATMGDRLPVLLRDVFGPLPFRAVAVDPSWLTSMVVALAIGIYEERAFERLPILADALQDAGCDDPDILGHCRGPGPHTRGCWVVDLLLGKK